MDRYYIIPSFALVLPSFVRYYTVVYSIIYPITLYHTILYYTILYYTTLYIYIYIER